MTDEQIIEMAKKSGIPIANVPNLAFGRLESGVELLKTFAKLVAQHEREACAKVCEQPGWNAANWCAKAIRARGQRTPEGGEA